MLRTIRITIAVLTFTGLLLLFLDFTGTLHHYLAWLAKAQFVPAVLGINLLVIVCLIVLTLLFGRVYCSMVCPLGIFQDLIARLRTQRSKLPYRYTKAHSWLRYGVLSLFVLALVSGLGSLAAVIEPYSIFGRATQNLLSPLTEWISSLLAYGTQRADSYSIYGEDVWVRSLPTWIVALLSILVVGVLAYRGGRTYCNTICPVGTFLGFLSRYSLMKVRIAQDKCVSCGICARHCKASCIDSKNHAIDYSRCVACGNCLRHCSHGALTYGRLLAQPNQKEAPAPQSEVDTSRRTFLWTLGGVTASAALSPIAMKALGGLAAVEGTVIPKRSIPITPPGSLSAMHLAQHCTACQLCVSQCPTKVLRPSERLMTLMQPEMNYERGWCLPSCNTCGNVCPTGAIQPIAEGKKTSVQIGHAVWLRRNCIVTREETADAIQCGRCAEVCPRGAIRMMPDPTQKQRLIPVVNIPSCIGCGACENHCPARPFFGIYVEGHEQHSTR
ncbi:MAG: 4Fe-4S binding protein [Bacteroidaceae bacterium]|nr:4Fe-4S binding protein [Bacteroidaceae bacterium]